jgi:hypothetical protein
MALRIAERGDPVARAGLGEDAVDVGLDRVVAEEQAVGDLAVGQALGDQAEDLYLALGQAVRRTG